MEPNRDPLDAPPPAAAEIAEAADAARARRGCRFRGRRVRDGRRRRGARRERRRRARRLAPEVVLQDSDDTLSPAVRRLVRQYDLDITGIHGTGPAGRIRVGDVIGMLGGRDGAGRAGDARGEETVVEARLAGTPYRGAAGRTVERAAAQAPSEPDRRRRSTNAT